MERMLLKNNVGWYGERVSKIGSFLEITFYNQTHKFTNFVFLMNLEELSVDIYKCVKYRYTHLSWT